jgi:hypothetical protein
VSRRRGPASDSDVAQREELERLCAELGRVEAPFDEITRSRAEARLATALAREPERRPRRVPGAFGIFGIFGIFGWKTALVAAGAAAAGALVGRALMPAAGSRVAGAPEMSLRFEPYVVAPTGAVGSAAAPSTVPETLVQSASSLDVPAGWLVRASLGDAIAITLTGPARAWSERENGSENGSENRRTVVHLDQGRLLASLEGGRGRRLAVVSPGAVTEVVGTLFSVEVVGDASRVAVAHGRVQVSAVPGSGGARPVAAREIATGQSWLTTLPEPEALEPTLADALADHERTPPPRGPTMPLSVTEAPAGAGVWVGKRRIASAPAWVLVEPHAAVRLSGAAPARAAAPPAIPPAPPSTEPAPSTAPFRPLSEPPARPTKLASSRPLITPPAAAPTEPPPLERASAPPEELTPQTMFREADAARAAGDTALALRTLRALVERFPSESATAAARYELALMEETAGSGEAALRDLSAVDAPALEEPKEYLRCRVLARRTAVRTTEAERCLADFRRRFPASAHDGDALATETALALARGGCAAAQALLTELERRHPEHASAARLRAACNRRP